MAGIKRMVRQFSLLVATGIALGAVLLSAQAYTNNFHAIVDGQAYRSGQPTPVDLQRYHQAYGIRTIINLRDEGPDAGWRRAEAKSAGELGIRYVEFPMSAGSLWPLDRARQLVDVMKRADKPVLIHCKSGADRTGLAAALYLAAVGGHDEEAAEGQLSLWFGHFAIPFFGPYEMDQTFETMEPEFGFTAS